MNVPATVGVRGDGTRTVTNDVAEALKRSYVSHTVICAGTRECSAPSFRELLLRSNFSILRVAVAAVRSASDVVLLAS